MDPNALWKDLQDELKELEKFPDNRDLRLHVCSLFDAYPIVKTKKSQH